MGSFKSFEISPVGISKFFPFTPVNYNDCLSFEPFDFTNTISLTPFDILNEASSWNNSFLMATGLFFEEQTNNTFALKTLNKNQWEYSAQLSSGEGIFYVN